MPPLAPGSHRLTVYAVRPWGEVVKAPGAYRQIRLNRVAANPLGLPAPGSPQLLPVSPRGISAAEPVLLDWLLIDAPLQNLRSDDTRWRLRVTVNGDSFLVQQQSPLWLKGWRPGSNAVLLELVDARGEPLNPPFNSLVREVQLDASAPRPTWLGPRLDEASLAQLLGEAPRAQGAGESVPSPDPTPAPPAEAQDGGTEADPPAQLPQPIQPPTEPSEKPLDPEVSADNGADNNPATPVAQEPPGPLLEDRETANATTATLEPSQP
jgi:hypothetical protein